MKIKVNQPNLRIILDLKMLDYSEREKQEILEEKDEGRSTEGI